jgi:multiple sugar transport system substrate-binding protein
MKACRLSVYLLLVLITASCSGIPTAAVTPTSSVTPTSPPTQFPVISPSPTASGPLTLHLWLPPEFDPTSGTPAGNLLQDRLTEFTNRRPGTRIDVRIKDASGQGGLLDTLTTASAAAPQALPDLLALPRPELETAALKGLLHPFRGLTSPIEDPDWYDYARQLARLQDSTFGIPFAGDAMALVYRPSKISTPPKDITSTLLLPGPLLFPAADPQALFTLGLYQAAGGAIRDDQGRPKLDANILAKVLSYYRDAAATGLAPVSITQFQTDEQAWTAFQQGDAPMVVTWTSRYLDEKQSDLAISPLPTINGNNDAPATGWVWALASTDPERQKLSTELAEFLSESDFLAAWTSAAGYLPTRLSAMAGWRDANLQKIGEQIALLAQPYPSEDVLTSLAPAVEQATLQVLKKQADPQTAAQEAAKSLASP